MVIPDCALADDAYCVGLTNEVFVKYMYTLPLLACHIACVELNDVNHAGDSQCEHDERPTIDARIASLPDADAVLDDTIEVYVADGMYTSTRTYTLPKPTRSADMVISKPNGNCDANYGFSVIDSDRKFMFGIDMLEAVSCRGWGRIVSFRANEMWTWKLIEFGGDAKP